MNLSQMRYYKKQKGYSFAKLSELSGVPVGTIQKIFNGETKSPRYDTLIALSKVLRPEEEVLMVKDPSVVYAAEKDRYTLDDYYAMPDEKRAELIDGSFYDMAAPTLAHQMFSMEICTMIKNHIRKKKGQCIVFAAPVDVQLDGDEYTMVQPDVLIVCDRDKLIDRCVVGAPDFIVEIMSSSTRKKDLYLKLMKYEKAGVREYWMVDINKGRIITYFFEEDDIAMIYGIEESVPVKIFGGELQIDFAEIVGYLKECSLDI